MSRFEAFKEVKPFQRSMPYLHHQANVMDSVITIVNRSSMEIDRFDRVMVDGFDYKIRKVDNGYRLDVIKGDKLVGSQYFDSRNKAKASALMHIKRRELALAPYREPSGEVKLPAKKPDIPQIEEKPEDKIPWQGRSIKKLFASKWYRTAQPAPDPYSPDDPSLIAGIDIAQLLHNVRLNMRERSWVQVFRVEYRISQEQQGWILRATSFNGRDVTARIFDSFTDAIEAVVEAVESRYNHLASLAANPEPAEEPADDYTELDQILHDANFELDDVGSAQVPAVNRKFEIDLDTSTNTMDNVYVVNVSSMRWPSVAPQVSRSFETQEAARQFVTDTITREYYRLNPSLAPPAPQPVSPPLESPKSVDDLAAISERARKEIDRHDRVSVDGYDYVVINYGGTWRLEIRVSYEGTLLRSQAYGSLDQVKEAAIWWIQKRYFQLHPPSNELPRPIPPESEEPPPPPEPPVEPFGGRSLKKLFASHEPEEIYLGSKWMPVKSSFITDIRYSEIAGKLDIKLKNGRVYTFDVPKEVFEALLVAPSKGRFFNDVILKQYAGSFKVFNKESAKSNWYRQAQGNERQDLEDIETCHDLNCIIEFLTRNKYEYKVISFPTGKQIVKIGDYIIDNIEDPYLRDMDRWFYDMDDRELSEYYHIPDFQEEFWGQISDGYRLYHATHRENLYDVMRVGLLPKNDSRGISNSGTGSAVFTSDNPDDIESYGDIVLEIDVGAMKRDGYMPQISKEEPLEYEEYKDALAHQLGMEDYHTNDQYSSEGLYSSTVVIYGKVPPQYLRVRE